MSVPFFARALFAYDAVESSELSVGVGEFLTIEEVNESGWCLARHGDLTGWLPTDYVQKIESELDSNSNSSSSAAGSNSVAVAAEPIQVSKPVNSREIQLAENTSPMKPAASTAVAQAAASNSNPSASASASAGLSEQLSQLIVNSGGVVPSSSSSAPNAKICASCHEPIKSAFVMAKEKPFHPNHFQCFTCKQELGGRAYLEKDDKFYCEQDYYAAFNPKCGSCNEVIQGPYISALDQSWHPDHFVCTECRAPFVDAQFRKHDGKPYCEKHFEELFAPKCSVCGLGIIGQVFEALNQKYHLACFTCAADGQPIGEGVSFHVHENKIYCPAHFEDLVLQKCYGCKLAIKGQYLKVLDHHYHPDCWKCSSCGLALKSDNCAVEQGKFYCKPCALKQRASVAPAPSSNGPVFQQIGSNPQAVPNMGAPTGTSAGGDSATEKANIALAAIRARQAADAEATAATAAVAAAASQSSSSSSSTAAYADPTATTYPYSLLKDKNSRPSDVDPTKKEQYLTNEEFGDLFKMSKEDFSKLPEWRRKAIKTPLMLF